MRGIFSTNIHIRIRNVQEDTVTLLERDTADGHILLSFA
jgi:hypothetical protein